MRISDIGVCLPTVKSITFDFLPVKKILIRKRKKLIINLILSPLNHAPAVKYPSSGKPGISAKVNRMTS